MSRYGDSDKEDLFEQMEGFLCGIGYYNKSHQLWELVDILSDVLAHYENDKERIIREEIESEYKGYKEKYESMSKIING